MSVSFFALPEDILEVFAAVFSDTRPTVYEVYSDPGAHIRSFSSQSEVAEYMRSKPSPYLGLWFPETMPKPSIERFPLNSGSHRYTVQGCGLFWLRVGTLKGQNLTASHLTWFTAAGARRKCSVSPGPDAVVWPAHKRIGIHLTGLLRRKLKAASVPGKPVLAAALAAHRAGTRLVEHPTASFEYEVGAT